MQQCLQKETNRIFTHFAKSYATVFYSAKWPIYANLVFHFLYTGLSLPCICYVAQNFQMKMYAMKVHASEFYNYVCSYKNLTKHLNQYKCQVFWGNGTLSTAFVTTELNKAT